MMESAPDPQPIGMLQLVASDHGWRLGFLLQQASWGQGLAAEAASAVLLEAFRQPGLHRVDAICDVDNAASASVLQKLGMQYEGCQRRYILHPNVSSVPRDVFLYALIRA
jgi:RimJ/RimL family protein N-acetyltransferase